jgi:hypothetical protein
MAQVWNGSDDFQDMLQIGTCFSPPFPKTDPIYQDKCFFYLQEKDYKERIFIDMYRFEKFNFFRAYHLADVQKALYSRYQRIQSCPGLITQETLEKIFARPMIHEGDVFYTELTGQAMFQYKDHALHGFGGWGAFVNRGLVDKPKKKLSVTVYYAMPQGETFT